MVEKEDFITRKIETMNKRWINKKVVYRWDGLKYVEIYADKYLYEGEIAWADEAQYAGHGGGGGGGAGGNGGVGVIITSNLTPSDNYNIVVTGGALGAKGECPADTTASNGVNGGAGLTGIALAIVV
jgi:hypothetical protein